MSGERDERDTLLFRDPRRRLAGGATERAHDGDDVLELREVANRGGRELLAENLIDEAIAVEPSRLSPLALVIRSGNPFLTEAFRCGDLYVQDEASQAAALVPPLRPGERVLDAAVDAGMVTSLEAELSGEDRRRCAFHVGPLRLEQGPDGAIVLVSDVTDRQRLQEQLLQTQKLDSMGQLAGGDLKLGPTNYCSKFTFL